jgi:hypothetical protein
MRCKKRNETKGKNEREKMELIEPPLAIPVVLNAQVLQRFHEAPLHVSRLGRFDRCVDKSFAPAHRVEEKFERQQTRIEGIGDEALGS